ncbi:MAG: hypothetical protein AB7O97_08975 [Planctomycetota bacterium]
MRTSLPVATLAALSFAAAAPAQHLVVYDPIPGTGMMHELQPPSPLLPAPIPPTIAYPIVPLLPAAGPAVAPPGDATYDGLANAIWFTDGALLASMPSPSFPLAGPAIPPFPIAPPVLAALGGPVTGIAIDPIAGILWVTSFPGVVAGIAPVPGTPIVVPPFPLAFPTGPISGLEWDGLTGTLLACDIVGLVYPFVPGGFPAGPPIGPSPVVPPPVGDVAIDKTGALNAAGVRSIYICGGPAVDDLTLPPLPLPTPTPFPTGLAFLPLPANNMPGGTCPCAGVAPAFSVAAPMVAGNPGFGLTIGGLPPGTPALMAYDAAFNPLFPLINVTGCGLGLLPGTVTLVSFFTLAGPGGVAVWPLPLTFLPPGLGPVYAQGLIPCTADPAGFTLTTTQQVSVCGH